LEVKRKMKLVIVGGVAGGAAAAARARRLCEECEIVMFERGPEVSFSNCGLPYYLGGEIEAREDLLIATSDRLRARYLIEVRTREEVVKIERERKVVRVRRLESGEEYDESYDRLILSPGAMPVRPPLPGADLPGIFTLRNLSDADRIKAHLEGGRIESAVVVGGGFIGLEMAENLCRRGAGVTIVEMLEQVMPPLDFDMASIIHHHLRDKGVELFFNEAVESFEKAGEGGGRISVKTASGREIGADIVLLAAGVKPDTKIAEEAGLETGQRGAIVVDDHMRTSDPCIYAVGDAVEVKDLVTGEKTLVPLAGPAAKQARVAADNALGRDSTFVGVQGTSVARVFDLTVASTGNSEKFLKRIGRPHLVSYTHSFHHANYYPGAKSMAIKLVFAPGDGRLLGAQIVGAEGVDKRIDVLATAVRAGMSVFGLEELELAYAPQYGSTKDPVNIAGFVASNVLKGDVEAMKWEDALELGPGHVLLDVRTEEEVEDEGMIAGALHVGLHDLRDKLDGLDRDKTYVACCTVGLRAYFAYRILVQRGFKASILAGGLKTLWPAARERGSAKVRSIKRVGRG